MIINQTTVHDLDLSPTNHLINRIQFYTEELSRELDDENLDNDQDKIDKIISAYIFLWHLMKVVKLNTK